MMVEFLKIIEISALKLEEKVILCSEYKISTDLTGLTTPFVFCIQNFYRMINNVKILDESSVRA